MGHEIVTNYGRPENSKYDHVRHETMRLRPIGYGYFHINRSQRDPQKCGVCGEEITELPVVRFINKKPVHKECFLKDARG